MNNPTSPTSNSRNEPPAEGPALDPEDGGLVERVLNGDAEAFEALFKKYRQRVFGAAWRVLRDEEAALDVVQDAFVKAYERLGDLRGRRASSLGSGASR
ncbi:MAG: hypothetical protein M5U26_08970 [Planctomycetota bacterium]|nr:hypothetical protein [Planctomycetota bacterium]